MDSMDTRGVTAVVGKTLEAGIAVLYIGLVTTVMFGGVVPAYEGAAAGSVGDRALASATERVQQAVPPTGEQVDVSVRVELPRTIAGQAYVVRADGRALVLDHPDPAVGGRATLALPAAVTVVQGEWSSREQAIVRVTSSGSSLVVRLEAA